MGAVGEPVEGTIREDRVGEEADPFAHVAVAGDDEAGVAMPLDNQRVEVLRLLLAESMKAEVIDHEQVRSEVTAEGSFGALVGPGLAEFAEEVVRAAEEDGVAGTRSGGTECLGEEGLADTNRVRSGGRAPSSEGSAGRRTR